MADGLKKVAIVVFSFTSREEEPGPCNIRLAKNVERIYDELIDEGFTVYIVAQWEVALQLEADGFHVNHVVHPQKGIYLDTDGVWEETREMVLKPESIEEITPVAHSWLQIIRVKLLIKRDGFRIIKKKIGKIGFDRSPLNLQPWTKGPVRALIYAVVKQLKRTLVSLKAHIT
jgi:predicted aspartyl protease